MLTVSNGVRRKFDPVSSKIVFRSKDSIIVPADELQQPASGRAGERASGRAGGRAGKRAGGQAAPCFLAMLKTKGFIEPKGSKRDFKGGVFLGSVKRPCVQLSSPGRQKGSRLVAEVKTKFL